jgi:hypothetical protein
VQYPQEKIKYLSNRSKRLPALKSTGRGNSVGGGAGLLSNGGISRCRVVLVLIAVVGGWIGWPVRAARHRR